MQKFFPVRGYNFHIEIRHIWVSFRFKNITQTKVPFNGVNLYTLIAVYFKSKRIIAFVFPILFVCVLDFADDQFCIVFIVNSRHYQLTKKGETVVPPFLSECKFHIKNTKILLFQ